MTEEHHDGDWLVNRRHVLSELGRASKAIEEMERKQDRFVETLAGMRTDLMGLGFRLTAWGVIAAAVPSAMMAIIWYLMHSGGK